MLLVVGQSIICLIVNCSVLEIVKFFAISTSASLKIAKFIYNHKIFSYLSSFDICSKLHRHFILKNILLFYIKAYQMYLTVLRLRHCSERAISRSNSPNIC